VVVVVGELPYAEMKGDRSDLSLAPGDAALIEKAKALGVPVVVVLYSGRPLVLGKSLEQCDAFVAAWLPGTEGEGVTDVLFGDFKPTGKLPRHWPRDNSELNSLALAADGAKPLFSSGFGLSCEAGAKSKKIKVAAAHE
jgi:beta-glucosidase